MRVRLFARWTRPWEECETCTLGLFVLNQGDCVEFGVGLFFGECGLYVGGPEWCPEDYAKPVPEE